MSHYDFSNRVALVTGGNAGIGKACSEAFAYAGATVIVSARREEESLELVKTLQNSGKKAIFIKADMAKDEEINDLFQKIQKDYGQLDFAVNNAGVTGRIKTPFEDYTLEDWHQVMNINGAGVFRCMQEEIKIMKKQGYGVIINMSSVAGVSAGRASPIYTASKHAVVGLTRFAAKTIGAENIRVNAICPGMTDTDMTQDASVFRGSNTLSSIPVGRLGKPEEIAETALWLCSDHSGFVNGSTIIIDGGILA